MHVHAVALSLKADAPPGDFERVVELLQGVVPEVEGMIAVYGGPNQSDYPSAFTHAIVIVMESHAVLAPYRAHPKHVAAIPLLTAIVGVSASLDLGGA
jgi:hypothetical protein